MTSTPSLEPYKRETHADLANRRLPLAESHFASFAVPSEWHFACQAEGLGSEAFNNTPLTKEGNPACTSDCTSLSVDVLIEAILKLSEADQMRLVATLLVLAAAKNQSHPRRGVPYAQR